MKIFHFSHVAFCPKMKSIVVPGKVNELYDGLKKEVKQIKKVYLYSSNLKKGYLENMPKKCTIYVKNKNVQRKLRQFGFKGKIVIKKKMAPYDKAAW